jgi:hypothetical protein
MPGLRTAFLACALTVVAAAPAVASVVDDAPAGPSLRVHAIFSGGTAAPWHVGQVLAVQPTGTSGLPRVAKVCWDPAPLERPECDAHNDFAAPSAVGTTTITATLADGTVLSTRIRAVRARTRYDGHVGAPGVATCAPTRLYGSYDTRTRRFRAPQGSVAAGRPVGRYNRLGADAVFLWDYRTNRAGFGRIGCVRLGLP